MKQVKRCLGNFPPGGLLSNYRNREATERNMFLAARACLAFRTMDATIAARLARSWFLLPGYLVADVLMPWLKYSGASQRTYGHSRIKQLLEVAIAAHTAMSKHTVCGWDIAVTEEGPVIVECNDIPGCPVPGQRPNGFYGTDFSQLLRGEILSFLDQLEPEHSRFRIQAGQK